MEIYEQNRSASGKPSIVETTIGSLQNPCKQDEKPEAAGEARSASQTEASTRKSAAATGANPNPDAEFVLFCSQTQSQTSAHSQPRKQSQKPQKAQKAHKKATSSLSAQQQQQEAAQEHSVIDLDSDDSNRAAAQANDGEGERIDQSDPGSDSDFMDERKTKKNTGGCLPVSQKPRPPKRLPTDHKDQAAPQPGGTTKGSAATQRTATCSIAVENLPHQEAGAPAKRKGCAQSQTPTPAKRGRPKAKTQPQPQPQPQPQAASQPGGAQGRKRSLLDHHRAQSQPSGTEGPAGSEAQRKATPVLGGLFGKVSLASMRAPLSAVR